MDTRAHTTPIAPTRRLSSAPRSAPAGPPSRVTRRRSWRSHTTRWPNPTQPPPTTSTHSSLTKPDCTDKRKPASTVSGEQSDHQPPAGASRPTGPQLTIPANAHSRDEQVRRDARVETRIRAPTGMGGGRVFVAACVRQQRRAAAADRVERCCLHANAVAPGRSPATLLHLAEEEPAEVEGALFQLVHSDSGRSFAESPWTEQPANAAALAEHRRAGKRPDQLAVAMPAERSSRRSHLDRCRDSSAARARIGAVRAAALPAEAGVSMSASALFPLCSQAGEIRGAARPLGQPREQKRRRLQPVRARAVEQALERPAADYRSRPTERKSWQSSRSRVLVLKGEQRRRGLLVVDRCGRLEGWRGQALDSFSLVNGGRVDSRWGPGGSVVGDRGLGGLVGSAARRRLPWPGPVSVKSGRPSSPLGVV